MRKKKINLTIDGTPVTVDDGTTITTYPSIYLWNQDATLNNEIPAWDVFQIPTAPIQ